MLWNLGCAPEPKPEGKGRVVRVGFSGSHLAFSPHGKVLACVYYGSEVLLWDMAKGKREEAFGKLVSNFGGFTNVAFHPEGKTLASGVRIEGIKGESRYAVKLFDIDREKKSFWYGAK